MRTEKAAWLLLVLLGCGRSEEPELVKPSSPARNKIVAAPALEEFVAVVTTHRSAQLASEIEARVEKVFVSMGATVEAGQPLLKLSDDSIKPQVAAAKSAVQAEKAALRGAQAMVSEAQRRLSLEQKLTAEGVTAQETVAMARAELTKAGAARDAAAAKAQSAQVELDRLEKVLRDTTMVSPIRGVVSVLRTTQGNVVTPGQTLLRVFDPTDLYVRFAVPAELAERVKVGSRVAFVDPASGDERIGVVRNLSPELEPPLQLVFAEADFEKKATLPAPGTVGRIRLLATTSATR